MKRLFTFAVARVAAASPRADGVTIRARVRGARGDLLDRADDADEATLASAPVRLARRIEGTDPIVDASIASAGIAARFDGTSLEMRVARAAS